MEENPRFPVSDWKYEVSNGDTWLGYQEWLEHRIESEPDDPEDFLYNVTVIDSRVVRYIVAARNQEHARDLVEGSDDADNEFGYKLIDSSWYVGSVEKESGDEV